MKLTRRGFFGGIAASIVAACLPKVKSLPLPEPEPQMPQQNPPVSGSNALRVESLEQTLRILTFTQAHIQFWRDIPKMPAFSTVEEYNVQTSYGSEGGMFTRAGSQR